MPFLFALTLFVSATLLFLVQPMVAKMILPLLGGTPAVWNTCMVFFQAALLAGYSYAHLSTTWLGVRRQAVLQIVLLLVPFAALVLPISIAAGWVPPGDANPIPWLLGLLAVSVGLPFFVLSTSAPLLQKWFANTGHPSAKDPYFLYAASNLGSMLALLGYPTLVEPYLPVGLQSLYWAGGYALLVVLTAACAVAVWRAPAPAAVAAAPATYAVKGLKTDRAAAASSGPGDVSLGRWTPAWWVALAFVPSSLMLGVTTYLTTDIAAIPLLWVIPLSLYLLSFILVFSRWPAAVHNLLVMVLPVLILLLLFLMLSGIKPRMSMVILLHLATLFVVSLVCHGELARSRPPTERLTAFYLWMSLGGVLGGLFNALVAPLLFTTVAEYPVALVIACLLLPRLESEKKETLKPWVDVGSILTLSLLALGLIYLRWREEDLGGEQLRTFFGLTPGRGLVILGILALAFVLYVFRDRQGRLSRLLDVGIAGGMGLLTVGLILGLSAAGVQLVQLTEWVNAALEKVSTLLGREEALSVRPARLKTILMFGLPPILCYTLIMRPIRFGLAVGAVFLAGTWCDELSSTLLHRERSFFGVLSVKTVDDDGGPYNELVHGTTLHGLQSLEPDRRDEPLTYYHRTGPIGQVFQAFTGPDRKENVALVGLGTGTLACYGEPGQNFTFYEIDPAVLRISTELGYFTYYPDCKANKQVVLGDARLRLAEAPKNHYGLIVLDAFSSDAIPVHLITREAVELYLDKLAPGGIIAFHISNRYLDLEPILANIAEHLHLVTLAQYDQDESAPGKSRSHWVLLARKKEDFGKLNQDERWKPLEPRPSVPMWTDDFSNLYKVFEWD